MAYLLHYGLFFIIYFGYFFPFWHTATQEKLSIHSVMFSYVVIILTLTIIPIAVPIQYDYPNLLQSINFIPFRDLINGYGFASREIALNTMMMIPFGFLFSLLTNKKAFTTIVATCLFSIMIETTQLMTILFASAHPRIVDITDVITNTLGGSIGYIFYLISRKLLSGKHSQ